jgi:L-iditol 2-dehydrogenase
MKACVFHAPGEVSVVEMAAPEPGPGELLLRSAAVGLCHSDVRVFKGEKYAKPGVVPGHEMAGVVAAVGEGVDGFMEGDRVAVCPIIACGVCDFCRTGRRNRCPHRLTLGYDENGGIAEYVLIPRPIVEMGHVFHVPDNLSLQLASLLEPTSCVLNSLELLDVRAGSTVLLVGAGPMGLLHLVLAKQLGAMVVACEPDESRRATARQLGAFETIDPITQDAGAVMKELTDGEGADVAVVAAGIVPAAKIALGAVRKQGSIGLFAGFPPKTAMDFDPNVIHYNEIVLTGSQNANIDQYRRTLELLPQLQDLRKVVTHSFSIDDAPKAYETRLQQTGLKSEVVFPDVI